MLSEIESARSTLIVELELLREFLRDQGLTPYIAGRIAGTRFAINVLNNRCGRGHGDYQR